MRGLRLIPFFDVAPAHRPDDGGPAVRPESPWEVRMPASRFRRLTLLSFLWILLLIPACTAVPERSDSPAKTSQEAEDSGEELAKKKRALDKARLELEIARLEKETDEVESRQEIRDKEVELALAREKLETFRTLEMVQKVRSAELDLLQTRYRRQDAAEELEQLEMMYRGSELEDKTSEIVLDRGRRELELADERMALEASELEKLRERDLPIELKELEESVRKAEQGVADRKRSAEVDAIRKRVEVLAAEGEIADLEAEIRKLEKKKEEPAKAGSKEKGPEESAKKGGGGA